MIGTLLLRLPDVPVPDTGINVGSFSVISTDRCVVARPSVL
jgi:hypothetical protein